MEENGLLKVRPCISPHLTEVPTGTGLSRASCDRWSLLKWKADGQFVQAHPSFQAKVTVKGLLKFLKLSTLYRVRTRKTDRAPSSCSLTGFTSRLVAQMFWGGCDIMWLERCWDIALVIFMAPRECSTLQGSWPNLPCGRSAPGLSLQFDNDWDLEQACTFLQYPVHVHIYIQYTHIYT